MRPRDSAALIWIQIRGARARFAIHHSILDPKETAAARDNPTLRRIGGRYGAVEPDERDARASTGKKKMRLVILSEVLTAQLWLRAHATMGDMAVEIEE